MAGDVANMKFCSPLKQHSDLTGNYDAICHYSYNLPLPAMLERRPCLTTTTRFGGLTFYFCRERGKLKTD